MIHVRGNVSHYAEWFHAKYADEYFIRHLDYIEDNVLHLDHVRYQSELTDAVLDAAKELGYDRLGDSFSKGFGRSRVTQRDGKRWTTSDKLDATKHVITEALVEKVLIVDRKAYGVNALISGEQREIFASKGVILTAGTLNTPKILQLSGIGPVGLLKTLDIPIVKDLPVGDNLQDHIGSGLDLILLNKSLSISVANILNPFNLLSYLQGNGPWTNPGCEVLGFLSTTNSTAPDVQVMVLPVGISSDRGSFLRRRLGITDEVWQKYFTRTFSKHTSTFFTLILHPRSSGTVYIKSRDPKIPPLVDPKYLSKKEDVDTLIEGLKSALRFLKTDSLNSVGAYLNTNPFPGCSHHEFFSDRYLECYVRHLTLSSYHPVGTCAMGLPGSKKSVVDTSFRVIGVQTLYVADASVMPTLPSGNINAAIAMMANIFYEINIKDVSLEIDKAAQCGLYDGVHQYLSQMCFIESPCYKTNLKKKTNKTSNT